MSQLLKQSTTTTIKMGPFLDATDGVTEETALTPAIEVTKNGGAFAARNSATAVAHDAEGYYDVELDTTDTGTLGRLIVKAHDSANHLPVRHEFTIVPANVYDSLVGGSDTLEADVTQLVGNAVQQTGGHIHAFDDAGNAISTLSQADILSDATPFAGASVDAAISSRSNHAAADVWSVSTRTLTAFSFSVTVGTNNDKTGYSISGTKQTLDDLNDITASAVWAVTTSEPTAVFAWGDSRGEVLDWLGALSRNKITQTSTTQTLRDDADGSNVATASVSDDGSTFTRGEWS